MYQTTITGDGLYHTRSNGYGSEIELFAATEKGETPMSLLLIALASCVTMCVQSYFKREFDREDLKVDIQANYDGSSFQLSILLTESLSLEQKASLLAYVDTYCRIKQLLRKDVPIVIDLRGDVND